MNEIKTYKTTRKMMGFSIPINVATRMNELKNKGVNLSAYVTSLIVADLQKSADKEVVRDGGADKGRE